MIENEVGRSINEKSILYELLVYAEWFQEQDINLKKYGQQPPSLWSAASLLNPKRILCRTSCAFDPKSVSDLPWRLAASQDGMVMALLQDTTMEIRTAKDGYVSIVGKASVGSDEYPNLRRVCWSPDTSAVAVAKSSGAVSLYGLLGGHLVSIPADLGTKLNPAIALQFLNTKFKHTKWSSELLIVQYDGTIRSYLISALDCHATEENIRFNMGTHYPRGISAAAYHPAHHMLLLTGYHSSKSGLTAWRILNDFPYLKISFGVEDVATSAASWMWFLPFSSKDLSPVITRMKVSPVGNKIACLQNNGTILLSAVPSLKILKQWPLESQPGFEDQEISGFIPVDIEWWSEDALVVVRKNGAVTVCSINNLVNLLGEAAEILCGPPQVASIQGNRQSVLVLDCEKHRYPEQNEESSEEDEASILQASVQAALYTVTDIETFQPKKRPPRLVQRTYRLLGIKSITPDELYLRKIENCAYEDALLLAQTYGLDTDLVYQRQWRTQPVSSETINNFLRQVADVEWVTNECINRVPDTFEAANELLRFGLTVTNCKTDPWSESKRKLVALRRKILYYFDGLSLYEKIIGNVDNYKSEEYDNLRKIGSLEAAVRFARAERRDGVSVLLTYRSSVLHSHYLPILSNFPETLRPLLYSSLLPELTADGKAVVPWQTATLRPNDWSETDEFKSLSFIPADDGMLYVENPALKRFNVDVLTPALVQDWYRTRAYQIERETGLVDYAAMLIKLAIDKNVSNLQCLHLDLLTLETLALLGDTTTSLESLQSLTHIEQALLLLKRTTPSSFVSDLKKVFLPFASRCQDRRCHDKIQLLKSVILHYSRESLKLPLLFLQHLKEHMKCPLALRLADLMELALDCVYNYPGNDQLDNYGAILECLPEKSDAVSYTEEEEALHLRIDKLENYLMVCEILEKSQCPRSVQYVRKVADDVQEAKALMKQVADSEKKPIGDSAELLDDLLELQQVFNEIDVQYCYELFASNRLMAGNSDCIEASEQYLSRWSKETWKPIPFERSVQIILEAANFYLQKSTAYDDPFIKLAEQCLKLVSEAESEIQEGLDLIEALQLLGHFGLRLLPLQVRMMPARWNLIEKCIQSSKEAYKSCELLMKLAQSLHLEGSNWQKREGEVLIMVGKAALEQGDYKFCSDVCSRLVSRNYEPAWAIALEIGSCRAIVKSKQQDFLAFAILHCPRDILEQVVETRLELRKDEMKFCRMAQLVSL